MNLYHVTTKGNAKRIRRCKFIDPQMSISLPRVWLCDKKRLAWAIPHIATHKRVGEKELKIISVTISRAKVAQLRPGIFIAKEKVWI